MPQAVLDHPTKTLQQTVRECVEGFVVGTYRREDIGKEDFVYETTQHSDSKGKTVVVERACVCPCLCFSIAFLILSVRQPVSFCCD